MLRVSERWINVITLRFLLGLLTVSLDSRPGPDGKDMTRLYSVLLIGDGWMHVGGLTQTFLVAKGSGGIVMWGNVQGTMGNVDLEGLEDIEISRVCCFGHGKFSLLSMLDEGSGM